MTEIEKDDTPELEGELQISNGRQKIFNNAKQLGEWLTLTQPKEFQVQPLQDGRSLLTWRNAL